MKRFSKISPSLTAIEKHQQVIDFGFSILSKLNSVNIESFQDILTEIKKTDPTNIILWRHLADEIITTLIVSLEVKSGVREKFVAEFDQDSEKFAEAFKIFKTRIEKHLQTKTDSELRKGEGPFQKDVFLLKAKIDFLKKLHANGQLQESIQLTATVPEIISLEKEFYGGSDESKKTGFAADYDSMAQLYKNKKIDPAKEKTLVDSLKDLLPSLQQRCDKVFNDIVEYFQFKNPHEKYIEELQTILNNYQGFKGLEFKKYKKLVDDFFPNEMDNFFKRIGIVFQDIGEKREGVKNKKTSQGSSFSGISKRLSRHSSGSDNEQKTDEKQHASSKNFEGLAEKVKLIFDCVDPKPLFGQEYKYINQLKYAYDLFLKAGNETSRQNFILTLVALQELNLEKFKNFNPPSKTIESMKDYVKLVLNKVDAKTFLPETWAEKNYVFGDIVYPSSPEGHATSWSAHQRRKIIRAAGPQFKAREINPYQDVEKFVDAISEFCPKQILSLGLALKDSDKSFIDYTQGTYGKYQVVKEKEKLIITKTLADGKTATHQVYYNNINVPDENSINLDYAGIKTLLAIYRNCDEKNPLLIHCVSGVGRTGQVSLLFDLLDELTSNQLFVNTIDELLNLKFDMLSMPDLTNIANVMLKTLNAARKIRPAIQVEEQFYNCLPLLLELRAVKKGFVESDEDFASLHTELEKCWKINKTSIQFNTFTPFTTTISENADFNQELVCRPRSKISTQTPEKYGQWRTSNKLENHKQGELSNSKRNSFIGERSRKDGRESVVEIEVPGQEDFSEDKSFN